MGRGRALEMILTGQMISAERAEAMGLVNRVFSQEELVQTVQKVAADLAAKSAGTARLALRAVNEGLDLDLAAGCALEAELFGQAGASADAHEGCAAFLEKRNPRLQKLTVAVLYIAEKDNRYPAGLLAAGRNHFFFSPRPVPIFAWS